MTSTRPPLLGLRPAALCAVLAGLLLWLAFPPVSLGLSAPLGVAALTVALWRASLRRGLGLGLIAGLVFFGLLLEWMRVIGPDAWLLLALLCAGWLALLGLGTALVTRLPVAPVWVAALWVLEEALRGRVPFGGFPWGDLAFSQPDTVLAPWAALGGTSLVTFAVALCGASLVPLARAVRARRWPRAGTWAAVVLATCVLPFVIPIPTGGDEVGGPPSAVVALVQGGTPQVGMGAMDVRRAVLDNHVRQTMDLAAAIARGDAEQPDFVLWPENSTDIDPFTDPSVAAEITAAARAVDAPILVGAVISVPDDPTGVWNVGIVWDPEAGPTQMYVKTHPVPFGEYIPFRSFLAQHIGRFDRVPRDFLPGTKPGNLTIGGVDVGNVICFEVAYGEVVDAVVDGGARLITVQTNNATYGGTTQPEQQLAIERMRATEFGRSVLVAATSGISAVIDTHRTVLQRLGEGQTGWLVADVPLFGDRTPASRIGHAVELALGGMGLVAIAVAVAVRRRERRPQAPAETA
jgi:apolipoprotein N-acyltransferase